MEFEHFFRGFQFHERVFTMVGALFSPCNCFLHSKTNNLHITSGNWVRFISGKCVILPEKNVNLHIFKCNCTFYSKIKVKLHPKRSFIQPLNIQPSKI